ncbi:MAG: clostripain-related cysteine peptidase [Candidatus Wallbacteria bacterium]|nr:clostripain-related cysteine peptidase [Candidatus Wallbacteria bacterium]
MRNVFSAKNCSREIALILLLTLSIVSFAAEKKPWTFMVYMCADNNLDPQAPKDINRLEKVGSGSNLNIVVEYDNSGSSDTSATGEANAKSKLYFVTKDSDENTISSKILQSGGEINMGDPKELVKFVSYCHQNYPAEKYCLVLWNHGGGINDRNSRRTPGRGICYDDTSNDFLTNEELRIALTESKAVIGKSIDLVEMDACLMGMIEVAYQLKDCASYVTFSEDTEPVDGIPYDKIAEIVSGNPSVVDLSKGIVSEFKVYYEAHQSTYQNGGVTKSAIDNSKIAELAYAVDGIAKALTAKIADHKDSIKQSRENSQTYGDTHSYTPSYTDLKHWLTNLKTASKDESLKRQIGTFEAAFDKAVLASTTLGEADKNSLGLCVYFPPDKDTYQQQVESLLFNKDTSWVKFLKAYYGGVGPAPQPTGETRIWSDWLAELRYSEKELAHADRSSDISYEARMDSASLHDLALDNLSVAIENHDYKSVSAFLSLSRQLSGERGLAAVTYSEVKNDLLAIISQTPGFKLTELSQ